MKMNPDMMPIMVAALDYDKLDSAEVTKKAEKEIAQIIDNPPENVLELSSEIKYTGIGNLTEYQSYTAMIYE